MPNLIGEKNSHMLMFLLNLAEQKTLHLCEYWFSKNISGKLLLRKAYDFSVFPSELLCS